MERKFKVVTLCGSSKFKKEFIEAYNRLTVEGFIVISAVHSDVSEVCDGMDLYTISQTKKKIKDMYKHKIDMSDELYVINAGGFIGEDTKLQIAYAKEHGKKVRYFESDSEETDQQQDKYVAVESLPISVRLCHILTRNQVEYLYQVENYSEEQLLKFRNMGQGTLEELKYICKDYGIHIYSYRDLGDESIGVTFTPSVYEKIFHAGIKSKDDIMETEASELAKLFGKNSVTYKKMMQIKKQKNR